MYTTTIMVYMYMYVLFYVYPRGTLTKGPILNDICKATGAYISVRGRYMTPQEKANQSPS